MKNSHKTKNLDGILLLAFFSSLELVKSDRKKAEFVDSLLFQPKHLNLIEGNCSDYVIQIFKELMELSDIGRVAGEKALEFFVSEKLKTTQEALKSLNDDFNLNRIGD